MDEGAKEHAREAEDLIKSFLDSSPDYIFLKDDKFRHIMINQAYQDFLGKKQEEIIGKSDFDLLPKELAKQCRKSDKEAIDTDKIILAEESYGDKIFETHKFPIKLQSDKVGIGGVVRDITERVRIKDKLEALHAVASKLQNCEKEKSACDIAVEATEDILEFEICAVALLEGEFLVPTCMSEAIAPHEITKFRIGEGIAGKTVEKGKTFWGNVEDIPEAEPQSAEYQSVISIPIGDIGNFQVISKKKDGFTQNDVRLAELLVNHLREALERIRLQVELQEQAIRDPLTGLYNRRYFNITIEKELERCKRYDHSLAFMLIDINRFKEINDRYSHLTGDEVLKEMAELLKSNVRETDIVVRYGGDEFLIVLPETDGELDQLMGRIRNKVNEWNHENDLVDFPLTLAIGSSYWNNRRSKSIKGVLHEADRRMYRDKVKNA